MPIFTEDEIAIIVSGNKGSNWVLQLCESHEELRKERDEILNKYRKLTHSLVDKVTIRETGQQAYKAD